MSELAEGARLEIVCTAKSGTEGSNPSLSATPLPEEVIPVTGNVQPSAIRRQGPSQAAEPFQGRICFASVVFAPSTLLPVNS